MTELPSRWGEGGGVILRAWGAGGNLLGLVSLPAVRLQDVSLKVNLAILGIHKYIKHLFLKLFFELKLETDVD